MMSWACRWLVRPCSAPALTEFWRHHFSPCTAGTGSYGLGSDHRVGQHGLRARAPPLQALARSRTTNEQDQKAARQAMPATAVAGLAPASSGVPSRRGRRVSDSGVLYFEAVLSSARPLATPSAPAHRRAIPHRPHRARRAARFPGALRHQGDQPVAAPVAVGEDEVRVLGHETCRSRGHAGARELMLVPQNSTPTLALSGRS